MSYRLVFADASPTATQSAVEADSPASALLLAQKYGVGRPAELWHDDKLLCRITQVPTGGFWEVG